MRPRKFALPQAGTGGYGIRPYVFLQRQSPLAEAVPHVELPPFVENEIRRGAFYMRPRKFALLQAGTDGYGIRPYIFCGGRSPRAEAAPRVEFSLFVENEIRRGAFYMRPYGGLSYRKRARADMESAPTFFVAGGGPPAEGGAPRGVFSLCRKRNP